jgi:ABC-2 type transport system ATP-binding protein
VIELRDVSFGYSSTLVALLHADLEIGSGLCLLVGPNGAGKSTVLNLMAGVEHPRTGTVFIDGIDLWRDEVRSRSLLSYVPENPDLSPYVSVGDVIRLVCAVRGLPAWAGDAALLRTSLDELTGRSVRELSLGQRRRVLLACALIGESKVYLLDEPLESMDAAMRALVQDLVGGAIQRQATIVLATHQVEPFLEQAIRVVAIARGRAMLVDPLPADLDERLLLLQRLAGTGSSGVG